MSESAETAVLMEGPMGALKEFSRILGSAGIDAQIVRPDVCSTNT